MLTLKQLYSRTTGDRKQRAQYVKVLQMKVGHNKEGLGYVAARTYSRMKVNNKGQLVVNQNPPHYVSIITFLDNKLHCSVSCSCEDNTFRWEAANFYRDAAEIEYSNGEAPDTTNPNYNAGLCKHLVAVYLKIQSKLPKGH